jgi:hypothetical protein
MSVKIKYLVLYMNNFTYENKEIKKQMGGKTVRNISIKNGVGYKSVTKYKRGKKIKSVKKPISKSHIKMIKNRVFIPGLFLDCKMNNNTRKL